MSFHVRSVIICDDVRFEMNRKEILIGVYVGGITVPAFPFMLQRLIIRFELHVASNEALDLRIIDPIGQHFHQDTLRPNFQRFEIPGAAGIVLIEKLIAVPGLYVIELGRSGSWSRVYDVNVELQGAV